MTDLEISKALALTIGWKNLFVDGHLLVCTGNPQDKVFFRNNSNTVHNHRIFDYRDWNVIGPIAEKYDCFPFKTYCGKCTSWNGDCSEHETPQKAIALAVIQGAKKWPNQSLSLLMSMP